MSEPESPTPADQMPTFEQCTAFRDFVTERTTAVRNLQTKLDSVIEYVRTIQACRNTDDNVGADEAFAALSALVGLEAS